MWKKWFAIFKVTVTVKACVIKICLLQYFLNYFLLSDFGLMAHRHKLGCLLKRLHCCVVLKVKVTTKVQNFNDFLSEPYLHNCWTFCNQIWYGDAIIGQSVMQTDWFATFKIKLSVRADIIKYDLFTNLLNYCSFCSNIYWDGTSPYSGVSRVQLGIVVVKVTVKVQIFIWSLTSPRGLTFMWWGCYGLCLT